MRRKFLILLGMMALILACVPTMGGLYQLPHSASTSSATVTATEQTMPTVQPTATATPTCTVTATSLHLRDAGRANAGVVGYLFAGDVVRVLDDGDWLMIETASGQVGFVHGGYCE